jgi:hypothetical protein
MPPILRSILAVLVGFMVMSFIVGIFTVLAAAVLHVQYGRPTPTYLACNVAYSLFAAGVAGFICALIAGHRPTLHAGILAAIMLAASVPAALHPAGVQPTWYVFVLMFGGPLAVVAGAAIFVRMAPARIS